MSSKVLKTAGGEFVRPYVLGDVMPGGSDGRDAAVSRERLTELEEAAYARGFEAGRRDGMTAGLESARMEAEPMLKASASTLKELESLRQDITDKSKKTILKLALAIARSIVHAEIRLSRDVIISILKAALRKMPVKDVIKVRLNPKDIALISGKKHDFLKSVDGLREMIIEEDPSVNEGGCIVEAGLAEVDATLDQQLEEVVRELTKGTEVNG